MILLTTGDRALLTLALDGLLPPARDFGVRVCVIWPGGLDAADRRAFEVDGVALIELPANLPRVDLRREAVRRSAADVTMMVEEAQALTECWNEVLAFRCGLVRHPERLRAPLDWRQALSALGVRGASDDR